MSTLADHRASVAAKGYTVDNATLDDAINASYREVLAARRWPFLNTKVTATLNAVSASVAVPTLTQIDAVGYFLPTGAVALLDWVDSETFRENYAADDTGAGVGPPEGWTRDGNAVVVYPVSDKAYTLQVAGHQQPAALVNPTDVLVIPTEYADAVTWGAVATLAFRQRDFNAADRAENKRDAAVNRMIRAYGIEQRQGGRQVRQTGIWD